MVHSAPVEFSIRKVNGLSGQDLLKASTTLALAFQNDQFTKVITGHNAEDYRRFLSSTLTASLLCGGEVYFAETRDQKVIGVAAWFGPGHSLRIESGPDRSGQGAGIYTGQFEPGLQNWWDTEFVPKRERLSNTRLGEGVKLNNWNLQIIATRPDYQRRGVARSLVDFVEHKAVSGGHPSKLVMETCFPVQVGIFKRLGWTVAREPLLFEGLDGVFSDARVV
ncbi:hypothetical protein BKA70DRAFT_1268269 [Coprinopsis sp. MPI-PUGE-AT-0042]|nr:hypothetical protein BKA70DRAFT_1268269 [Coprinopsis sp. MPI-PUGE-AT-0042]